MEPTFNRIIVGMTACGKTHYLIDTLEREYRGVFDHIVLVCLTFSSNKTYRDWPPCTKDPCFVAIECEQDQVDKVLIVTSDWYAGTSTLIVLDDCASAQDVKNRTTELVRLALTHATTELAL